MKRQSIRLSRPADILAMVPYLVGFHPDEAVVALLMRSGTVILTIRVDMPPPVAASDLAGVIASISDRHEVRELVVVGYSSDVSAARQLLTAAAAKLDSYRLRDVLIVDGQRWWSLMCTGACCPEGGRPYDPGSSPIAAEAVYAGLGVLPDRRALQASVGGPPSDEREHLRQLADQASDEISRLELQVRMELMRTLVQSGLAQPKLVDDASCARLSVLAAEVAVRDVAWQLITRDDAEQHIGLWARVVSRTTSPFEAAPLCLLGLCAWISGQGALMNCCIERAASIDPDYSLGRLLDKISTSALPPSLWDELHGEAGTKASPMRG